MLRQKFKTRFLTPFHYQFTFVRALSPLLNSWRIQIIIGNVKKV